MTPFHLLFAVMCVIWGLTWIAIKTGVAQVPPFFFAGARLLTAGGLLLLLARVRGRRISWAGRPGRIVWTAFLVNTVAYGMVFWGMQYVPSGLSAVVNLALIPLGLFAIGLLAKEETFSNRKLVAIVLGVLGLATLFIPKVTLGEGAPAVLGMIALVVGTLSYCWGSVLSRPLLRQLDAMSLSGLLTLIGGLGLVLMSLAFEPVGRDVLTHFFTWPVLASWAFLVLGGSVVAFTIYLYLLRDWGPSRAGLYAFVSPVVAVALGVALFGEPFGAYELTGSAVMLFAASLAMKPA